MSPSASGSPRHHGPYTSGIGFLQMFMDAQRVDPAVSADSVEDSGEDTNAPDERRQQ